MKKYLILLLTLILVRLTACSQCDMRVFYSAEDQISGNMKLGLPDGNKVELICDTAKNFRKNIPLKQLGKYELTTFVYGKGQKSDTLVQSFEIKGDELKVHLFLDLNYSIHATAERTDSTATAYLHIIKYTPSSPDIKIRYLENTKENGPTFEIKNESCDTIYGEHLPGLFWGRLSVWTGKEYTGDIYGVLCSDSDYSTPIFPDSTNLALVGSLKKKETPRGPCRFSVHYTTKPMGYKSFSKLSNDFRWYGSHREWHVLTCDFEKRNLRIEN